MKTILVVDDEFGITKVLEAFLCDYGYRVVTARNGREGLACLAEARPDVVLLDYMMPILDGADMLRAMAAEPAYRDIPVIMMSALEEWQIAEKCTGYAAFLRKPFRPAAIIKAIGAVLGNGNEGSE